MGEFNLKVFGVGVLVIVISSLFIGYHRFIADHMGGGVGDYQRYKKWGFVSLGVGILILFNIHSIILKTIVGLFISN